MINEQFIDRVINVLLEMRLDEGNKANKAIKNQWVAQQRSPASAMGAKPGEGLSRGEARASDEHETRLAGAGRKAPKAPTKASTNLAIGRHATTRQKGDDDED